MTPSARLPAPQHLGGLATCTALGFEEQGKEGLETAAELAVRSASWHLMNTPIPRYLVLAVGMDITIDVLAVVLAESFCQALVLEQGVMTSGHPVMA